MKIFNDGRQKFNALIDDINKAKHHVHMEYYIFRMDRMGHEIYDALLAAAKRGVEVKLLIDAWGSNKTKMSNFKRTSGGWWACSAIFSINYAFS